MPGPVPAGVLLMVGALGETVVDVGTGIVDIVEGSGVGAGAGAAPGWH